MCMHITYMFIYSIISISSSIVVIISSSSSIYIYIYQEAKTMESVLASFRLGA